MDVSMPMIIEANLRADGMRMVIVASRFNSVLVEKLVDGALSALSRHGAEKSAQTVVWVPGAWEIPVVAQKLARSKRYDAVVCVGVLMKGETYHFDYVASEANKGIAKISLETGVPLTMGILTVDTTEQALERCGGKMGNQGWNAAVAALETVDILRRVEI